jgi:hypothetical protein
VFVFPRFCPPILEPFGVGVWILMLGFPSI